MVLRKERLRFLPLLLVAELPAEISGRCHPMQVILWVIFLLFSPPTFFQAEALASMAQAEAAEAVAAAAAFSAVADEVRA